MQIEIESGDTLIWRVWDISTLTAASYIMISRCQFTNHRIACYIRNFNKNINLPRLQFFEKDSQGFIFLVDCGAPAPVFPASLRALGKEDLTWMLMVNSSRQFWPRAVQQNVRRASTSITVDWFRWLGGLAASHWRRRHVDLPFRWEDFELSVCISRASCCFRDR
jgi:hypothetical protein